ncbi:class I SAM-dependent methyltransferase [Pseudoalteromonas sp. R3]|uniref:class I SAM-dependent methyltransferase n=1 Tax=Pseudoalteromonas sp. R3 TaxID=1709477 RepID=UPI0006B4A9AB|nr:class I SAM-dependent methyltransferase [Pseudoalteromonas sp. R3]AZZ97530.1 class I SAM-dependent methyltransferase [Pseudoalteromonas sp. R3]
MKIKKVYVEELITTKQINAGLELLNKQYDKRLKDAKHTVKSIRKNKIRFFGCFLGKRLVAVFGLIHHFSIRESCYGHLFGQDEHALRYVATVGQLASINQIRPNTLYSILFDTAQRLGISKLYAIITEHEPFYTDNLDATIHKQNCDIHVGSDVPVTAISMDCQTLGKAAARFIRRSPSATFKYYEGSMATLVRETCNSDAVWGPYQRSFTEIITSVQQEVYLDVAEQLDGPVLDVGCGPANLLKFIPNRQLEYHGIDQNPLMVLGAQTRINELGFTQACAEQGRTEQFYVSGFGVKTLCSINSLYAAQYPYEQLKHLANQLKKGGTLWLANPNPNMTEEKMAQLLANEKGRWGQHPLFDEFCNKNIELVKTFGAHFFPLEDLCEWLTSLGLEIKTQSSDYFDGAVNLIQAVKQ